MPVKMEDDKGQSTVVLRDIREKCKDVLTHIQGLVKKAEEGEFSTSKGISFLEVKYQLLLSYLINLTYVMLRKSHGQSIEGDNSIDRLVEIRTILEKIRPIDQKLKYQVDKVIRIAATGGTGASDPMRFHANPDNLESKLDNEESEGSGSEDDEEKKEEEKKTSKVYRPPKLAAVHYDGDESAVDKKQRQLETLRKRALSSDIMRDLQKQYDDRPEEVVDSRDLHRMRENKRAKERTRYEEDNFMRMTLSKKERSAGKRLATVSSLQTLTKFDSISALDYDDADQSLSAKKRKLDKGKKGKKGKKGFKKRRKF